MADRAILLRGFLSAAERAEILAGAPDPCAPGRAQGWEQGRQGTGYRKRALPRDGRAARAEAAILAAHAAQAGGEQGAPGWAVLERDGWLLWYPAGVGIAAHTDPVGAGAHWRLNVVIAGGRGRRGRSSWRGRGRSTWRGRGRAARRMGRRGRQKGWRRGTR